MNSVQANPESGLVDGLRGVYNDDQFAELPRAACPVCGTAVTYDRVRQDASMTNPFGAGWTVGRWSCPANRHHAPSRL